MEFKFREPIIFLLYGKARSGKTTIAEIIKEYYSNCNKKIIITELSKYLKQYAKEYLNWDGNDETKPREFLQFIGTEVIRTNIDPLFLTNRLCQDIQVYSYLYDCIVVGDVRMPDELEIPKQRFKKVYSIKVVRPGIESELTKQQQQHKTEVALDNYDKFDYIIENTTLEKLKEDTINIIKEVDKND